MLSTVSNAICIQKKNYNFGRNIEQRTFLKRVHTQKELMNEEYTKNM